MKTMKIIPFDIALREQIQSEENHYQGRYKVQTRNGDDVKIIYWDKRDRISREYSIVGLQTVNDTEFITTCTKDGKYSINAEPNNNDLVLIDTWEPELKESEDERVRKAILGLVYLDGIEPILTKCSVTRSDILSYLEKQKEPHYAKRNALFDKCVENCDPVVMKEVSDEVDEMLGKEQKPAEWSEEDENNIGKLHRLLVICQSEKKFIPTSEYEKLDKWLKSLRPQPHWKPSKEQLGYLSKAIATLAEEGDGKTAAVLNELRKDLKNL